MKNDMMTIVLLGGLALGGLWLWKNQATAPPVEPQVRYVPVPQIEPLPVTVPNGGTLPSQPVNQWSGLFEALSSIGQTALQMVERIGGPIQIEPSLAFSAPPTYSGLSIAYTPWPTPFTGYDFGGNDIFAPGEAGLGVL